MSCPTCDSGDATSPISSFIYEGTQWRLEHQHPTRTLGASALTAKRRVQALHELNAHEWKELHWLLSNWCQTLHGLTACSEESLTCAPCCKDGALCFELGPKNKQESTQVPDEAIASFCLQARRAFLKRIEDVHVLDVDEGLRLRSLQLSDAKALAQLIDENRLYLREWLAWVDFNRSTEDSKAFIRAAQEGRQLGTDYAFGIELDERLVGCMGIVKPRSAFPWGELGYWISEQCSGLGLVTRCGQRLLEHAFDTLKLARVEIRVHPANQASLAVAERLGASREGICPKGYLRSGGVLQDAIVYAKVRA